MPYLCISIYPIYVTNFLSFPLPLAHLINQLTLLISDKIFFHDPIMLKHTVLGNILIVITANYNEFVKYY